MAIKRINPKDKINQENAEKETVDSVYNFTVSEEEIQTDNHESTQTDNHTNVQVNDEAEGESEDKPKDKEELKRQTYYISADLIEAMTMKVFMERDKKLDKSKLVRDALYAYIEDKYFVK